MNPLIKKLIVLSILFWGAQGGARTIYLQSGENYRLGPDMIVCEGSGGHEEEVKWWCACFNGDDNLGAVYGVWAPDHQRSAEERGIQQCWREKRQRITSVSCHKQSW